MLGAQVLGFIAGVIILTFILRGIYKRKLGWLDSLLWITVSTALIFFSFDPYASINFMNYLAVDRFDSLVVLAIILIFVINFRIHLRIEDTNRMLTTLVQKIAIELSVKGPSSSSKQPPAKNIDIKDNEEV